MDSPGQPVTRTAKEDIRKNMVEAEIETLDAYGAELWVDLFPAPEDLGQPAHGRAWELPLPTSSQVNVVQQRADDYTTQKVTEAILASPDDFDAIWDEMQTELEAMGIEEANEEMTGYIHNRIELWEGEVE